MNKIGLSLSPELLRDTPKNEGEKKFLGFFGSSQQLLQELQSEGIQSIELRYIPRDNDDDYADVYRLIWGQGLELTVHGRLEGSRTGPRFGDHYPALQYALDHYRNYQQRLLVNVHAFSAVDEPESISALSARTIDYVQQWIDMLEAEQHAVDIALELNRLKPNKYDPGSNIINLLQLVRQLPQENVGICWDMGHYYFNYIQAAGYEQLPAELQCGLPVEEFIKRTVHTHIHGLSQQRTTHFPMKPDESLPLETYIHSLQKTGYSGVYNLELDFQRFIEEKNMLQQVYETIDRLKRCIH